jgi:hypothetical protein
MDLEKLVIKESVGWIPSFGDIPYKVRYNLDTPEGEFSDPKGTQLLQLNARSPGINIVTQDLPGPGFSLSVFIYEGTPEKYKEIVLYHELVEAHFFYELKGNRRDAHIQACKMHEQYVREYFPDIAAEFLNWSRKVKI